MKRLWVINHYAVPPSRGTFVRQFYFAKHLQDTFRTEIFTSSKIHNTNINIAKKRKKIVSEEYQGIPFHYIKNIDYHSNGLDRILNMIQFAVKVLFISSKKFGKPDVVYSSSPDLLSTFFSVFLAKRHNAKLIVEVRDIWPWSIVEYSKRLTVNHIVIKLLSKMEKWIYKKSDALIFTMKGGLEYLKDRKWGNTIRENKVYYINNGVSVADYLVDNHLENVVKTKNVYNLVYCGSLRVANDIPSLIETMRLLPSYVKLRIYGSGGDSSVITEMISEKNISNVEFMGRIDKRDIPTVLHHADATILHYKRKEKSILNKYGSSQNKLIEYLAAGKPVLSNQEFGYDIVNSNNCGISKNCSTPDEFANLILEFSQLTQEEYQKICDNCINTAYEFDWRVLAKEFEKILSKLVFRGEM